MGKKSKNPRKADKGRKDSNPAFRAVDKILANAKPREGLPPLTAPCQHMKAAVANMERLEQLRSELKECLGRRDEKSLDMFTVWSIKSRVHDGYYRNMLDLVVATAADYLLQYDCSSENSKIHTLVGDLIFVACALEECDEGYGVMEERKRYKDPWAYVPDLTNRGYEKASVHAETELSIVRYIYKKAPCRCLKALKSSLEKTYGPQFGKCKNSQCQKVGEIDDFEVCSGCLGSYCSETCWKIDWDTGKHGGFCKPRSGKRAVRRVGKMALLGISGNQLLQMDEQEKDKLFQILDSSTKEDLTQQMMNQNLNVDE